ncbi:MAG: cytoplasmic protein [Desulfobulbaceae bacterium A2]|nr:MAG: cytoplasmic protein [Desulfobulbaceae bacterium A2]
MKIMFVAFRGEPLCFIHVLLNALDMHRRGLEGKIILEGESTRLVALMTQPDHFLHALYCQAREAGLVLGACHACATKLGAVAAVEQEGIPLIGPMAGHPALADYLEQGYTVLNF